MAERKKRLREDTPAPCRKLNQVESEREMKKVEMKEKFNLTQTTNYTSWGLAGFQEKEENRGVERFSSISPCNRSDLI